MIALLIVTAILAGRVGAFVETINFNVNHIHASNTEHPETKAPEHITAKYFTQRLDHFDLRVPHTFQQRYFERTELWKKDGPIFIIIGGEDDTTKGDVFSGITEQLATETHGALIALEHRYYGVSLPFQLEHNVANMKYLKSKQVLADIAEFIVHLKQDARYRNSKVVAIGGSYAGNLAAWMRVKYPNLVDAALASSAPLLAKVDFAEYYETVGEVYKKYGGEACYLDIQQIFKRIQLYIATKKEKSLRKMLNICPNNDISDEANQFVLLSDVAAIMASRVQYGDPQSVKDYCAVFAKAKNESVLDLGLEDCFEIDHKQLLEQKSLEPWLYQQCTEFGFDQTTNSKKSPFRNAYKATPFHKVCSEVFGLQFTEEIIENAVNRTNAYYGGLDPSGTRIVFTHGSMDPWAKLGVTEQKSTLNPVVVIDGASHCADLFESEEDSEYLKLTRAQIKFWIKYWLENEDEARTDQKW